MLSQQLTLNVSLREGFRFKSYYVKPRSSNELVINALTSFVSTLDAPQNFLWGESKSGKTHLLQACCAKKAEEHCGSVSYIPLKLFKTHGAEVLKDLSQSPLVVIDDVDTVLGNKEWEIALFHFINNTRENQQHLLLSSVTNPRNLDCLLPDLASRLIWGASYQLQALSDEDKPKALQARAQQRGFELTDRVIEFIYRRYPRDIGSLMKILDKLDEESLRQKTVITIPFVKQVLG